MLDNLIINNYFFVYQVEHTKHTLEVQHCRKNSLQSSDDTSLEKIHNSTVSLTDRQQELLRRCLKMLTSSPSATTKMTERKLQVKIFIVKKHGLIIYLFNRQQQPIVFRRIILVLIILQRNLQLVRILRSKSKNEKTNS